MFQKSVVLPATEELIARIGWFIRLRWVAIVCILAFVELGRRTLPVQFYRRPVYAILGVLALYNLAAWLLLRAGSRSARGAVTTGATIRASAVARFLLPRIPDGLAYDQEAGRAAVFANAQIMIDLVILAALLHYTGGVENPLRMFFVFHVIIASILLSRAATYLHATLGLLLFAAMAFGELAGALPHYSLQGHWRAGAFLDWRLVATQLFLLGVTLYATAYMGTTIAVHLRKREVEVVVLSGALEEKATNLEAAYREVSEAERAKSQYMRKVAHELRGPLGTIKTALGVALDVPRDAMPERTLDLVRRAERRAGELATMTQELLSLARTRGSLASAEFVTMEPAAICCKVAGDQRPSAAEAGLVFTVTIAEDLPATRGDPEGWADLVTNLLTNAIRYTPRGGRVSLELSEHAGAFQLVVSDTGIGIAPEDLPRIYDEFFRARAAREHAADGSGLGMAIVKAVVERHGGTIGIETAARRGTAVRVTLPVVPPSPDGQGHAGGRRLRRSPAA